jgi:ParE toxin of type II toxin-antitoxin system, parDE
MSIRYKELISEEAKQDIAAAMSYYGYKSKGLDLKFFVEFPKSVIRILEHSFSFRQIFKQFRQTSVRKFPYIIFYEIENDKVIIYAVFNTWQNPKKLTQRAKK